MLTTLDGALMSYVIISGGPIPVVVVPGGGDGLTVASDAAAPRLAWIFHKRVCDYRMLVLSRHQSIALDCEVERHSKGISPLSRG